MSASWLNLHSQSDETRISPGVRNAWALCLSNPRRTQRISWRLRSSDRSHSAPRMFFPHDFVLHDFVKLPLFPRLIQRDRQRIHKIMKNKIMGRLAAGGG